MSAFMQGVSIGGFILLFATIVLLFGLALWFLAKQNTFFTTVNEGEAKAVVTNGQFTKFLMSFKGHRFNDGSLSAIDKWNIVEKPPGFSLIPRFLRGIHWIGIWPFAQIHTYKFAWTSLEDQVDQTTGIHKNLKFTSDDELLTHILVQQDTYVSRLDGAECKDNIPLDVVYLITGEVVNPYKALFRVERWLEATQNLVGASLRHWVGERSYEKIRADATSTGSEAELTDDLDVKKVQALILEKYGFNIVSIKLYSVAPGSEMAKEFVKASTVVYVAEQKAKADKIEGQGLKDRVTAFYGTISGIPGGIEAHKWEQIAKSGLGTYVEGGASRASVTVPTSGRTPAAPSAPAEEPAPTGTTP